MRYLVLLLALSTVAVAQYPDGLVWDGSNFRYGTQAYKPLHKFGYNLDIDTGTDPEDVWSYGGTYTGWLTTADTVFVVSSTITAADSVGGTGARTVVVEGLDANYNLIEQIATMAGSANDTLATTMIRVFRAYVTSTGSGLTNATQIVIKSDEGAVMASIPAGMGQTEMAIYTIPAGYKGLLLGWDSCIQKTGAATGMTFHVDIQSSPTTAWRTIDTDYRASGVNPCTTTEYLVPVLLDAQTNIRLRVQETTADNAGVHASFDIWLIR